ncbi:sensor histidine kinase [Roseivivax sediminis]|uniref:histidine kinase n=1 Tax=Roseivivax sediminis TaxID=936889 RepID=A0A1I2AA33_9RHOB|nr:sensor histidine kinase [Roseivivax sediminis]SFE40619.1 Two-component sensor histidine kinase, contains HisKA and HATPase domains [Roseivivax sediminis]
MQDTHPSSAPNKAVPEPDANSPPVLILAPLDADADALSRRVAACGLSVQVCDSAGALGAYLDANGPERVLFLVVSQEGANSEAGRVLDRTLSNEPSWARLPIVFLVSRAQRLPPACRILDRKEHAPPFIVLERPAKATVLHRVFEAQAEARRRQFETRDLLDHLAREEERRRFLLSELRHRTRNSLAVLQSLFSMSVRRAKDLESFARSFAVRLRALTDAHVSLTQEGSALRNLGDLLREHVQPYAFSSEQLRLSGPAVTVSERLAFDLALVTHELATNAAKYGALSVEDGRVDVTWEPDGETGELDLVWKENGGPKVEPPERQGLGTRVIGSFLAGKASAALDFAEDGVAWHARIDPDAFEMAEDPRSAAQ